MKPIITFLLAAISTRCMAQGITGKVLDEKKEPLITAHVQVFSESGTLAGGNVTDYDGYYLIKPLDTGRYTVIVRYAGFDSATVTGIVVQAGTTTQNFGLTKMVGSAKNVVREYKRPLVNIVLQKVIDVSDISRLPNYQDPVDLVGSVPNLYQKPRDSREGVTIHPENTYVIDGNIIMPVLINNIDPEPLTYSFTDPASYNPYSYKFIHDRLASMPITDLRDAISLLPGVYQARRGDDISVFGSRYGGSQYIVDGMRQ